MLPSPSLASLPKLALPVKTAVASDPRLLAWNEALARELGIDEAGRSAADLARIFSGPGADDGIPAFALAYAGHQFGYFVPQLGDGRAALIGELRGAAGERFDVQLKGSGRTPFSRGGDGKSALGPVIREYLVSEAMHALGIPTTRALAAVATGEQVIRDTLQPAGVLTRVAASHLRVGTFQYFAARDDAESIRQLVDHAIERHYPNAAGEDSEGGRVVRFFASVASAQARLVAGWMSVGFVHGVMNTDNTSIAGETLDYGPCAFLDEYRHDKVFSSIDHGGRYAFGNQPAIAQWNLARLAECLLLICDEQEAFAAVFKDFLPEYEEHYLDRMRAKLGFTRRLADDEALVTEFLELLEARELDYTLSFRRLAEGVPGTADAGFGEFEQRWRGRLAEEDRDARSISDSMNAVNPLFIPRNHRIEEAIAAAVDGELAVFNEMIEVLASPCSIQPALGRYAEPPKPEERVRQTFCGT